jgi:hypothetical protein
MVEAAAAALICALMFIPLANIAVGAVAGLVLFGWVGALGGALIGVVMTFVWYNIIKDM